MTETVSQAQKWMMPQAEDVADQETRWRGRRGWRSEPSLKAARTLVENARGFWGTRLPYERHGLRGASAGQGASQSARWKAAGFFSPASMSVCLL